MSSWRSTAARRWRCSTRISGPSWRRTRAASARSIFAGLPVPGSDTGDYLVRNLMAIDPRQGWIVLGAEVAPGDPILFCRRDPDSAHTDLGRMLSQLEGPPAGTAARPGSMSAASPAAPRCSASPGSRAG